VQQLFLASRLGTHDACHEQNGNEGMEKNGPGISRKTKKGVIATRTRHRETSHTNRPCKQFSGCGGTRRSD